MKALVPFFLLFVLAGCTPSKELEAEKPSTPPATSTASTPGTATPTAATGVTASNSPAATAPKPLSPGAPKDEKPVAPDPTDNPNRAFQLRTLKHATLKANGKSIDAWLMDTMPKQTEGMMFLTDKDVKDNQGMLFVYNGPRPKGEGFWMKNTILPLDIIFIAHDHKVLNIQKGKPQDETNLPPAAPYQYVLELKQGQAEKLGIKPETPIDIPSGLRAED